MHDHSTRKERCVAQGSEDSLRGRAVPNTLSYAAEQFTSVHVATACMGGRSKLFLLLASRFAESPCCARLLEFIFNPHRRSCAARRPATRGDAFISSVVARVDPYSAVPP